jgi:hypothetical protein
MCLDRERYLEKYAKPYYKPSDNYLIILEKAKAVLVASDAKALNFTVDSDILLNFNSNHSNHQSINQFTLKTQDSDV